MPQDFSLKLSVLGLGPARNVTATECVFSLPFLPSVLLRFPGPSQAAHDLTRTWPPGVPTSEDPDTRAIFPTTAICSQKSPPRIRSDPEGGRAQLRVRVPDL